MTVTRRIYTCMLLFLLIPVPALTMPQRRIDELNTHFPRLGDEFQQAVAQKLSQYPDATSVYDLITRLTGHPEYAPDQITNTAAFGLHSELLVLYPAVGEYERALQEARLLRDFVLANPPDDPEVVVTFRGVYTELLVVNARYEEALQECHASQSLAPEEEGIYLSKGVIYTHLGDLEQVLSNLEMLVRLPDPKGYARQLFDFLMGHRHRFQPAQIQQNTLIDVMLRDLAPERSQAPIKIPAPPSPGDNTPAPNATPTPSPVPVTPTPSAALVAIQEDPGPLAALLAASQAIQTQVLGPPLSETLSDTTLSQDFSYNGYTLTIDRDRQSQRIFACSMFFLPPVSEIEAFAHIGVSWANLPPTMATRSIKVWSPYGPFSKVRVSLAGENVVSIVVQP